MNSALVQIDQLPDSDVLLQGHTSGELAYALNLMDSITKAGDKIEVSIVSRDLPSESELANFVLRAARAGIEVSYPDAGLEEGLPTTTFTVKKPDSGELGATSVFPVAALIGIIPTVLIVGLVAFGMFKIESLTKALMPIILVTVGGLIILVALATRKPVLEAAGKYAGRYRTQNLPLDKPTREDIDVQILHSPGAVSIRAMSKTSGATVWEQELRGTDREIEKFLGPYSAEGWKEAVLNQIESEGLIKKGSGRLKPATKAGIPENLEKAVAVLEIVKRPGTYIGIMPTVMPGHYYKLESPYRGLFAWGATSTYRPSWIKEAIEQGYLRLVRGELPEESFKAKTELPPEWRFIEEEPEPILEVTPGMLPKVEMPDSFATREMWDAWRKSIIDKIYAIDQGHRWTKTQLEGFSTWELYNAYSFLSRYPGKEEKPELLIQSKEKGWKDFFKGNRIQASIDACNYRIKERNVSEAEQQRLHETLKTPLSDLVDYQNLQSFGFASGILTKEEAEQLYRIYGGEVPSPEKWDKLTLAEKVTGTRMAEELLNKRLHADTIPEKVAGRCPPGLSKEDFLRNYATPQQKTELERFEGWEVVEIHDDCDLTFRMPGKERLLVMTTDGEVFAQFTGKEALQKILTSEFVTITDPGNTSFKKGDVVALGAFMKENRDVKKKGKKPASGVYNIGGEEGGNGNGTHLLDYLSDSPEYLAHTIDMSGWRERLDEEFLAAVARSRK